MEISQRKMLKDIQLGNNNIQASVSLLTEQNEEFKKELAQLKLTIQEDKKYISLLEDKIEDLQIDEGSRKPILK